LLSVLPFVSIIVENLPLNRNFLYKMISSNSLSSFSRNLIPFSSPIAKDDSFDDDITSPLRSTMPRKSSYKKSPLQSPPLLGSTIPSNSPSIPPARFMDSDFKKPLAPHQTPRNIIKNLTKLDTDEKTPRKLIGSLAAPTPLELSQKLVADAEEPNDLSKDVASSPNLDTMNVENLYQLVNNLSTEVKYLESVKDTLTKVLQDTERDRLRIQEMAESVQQSDQQLASVDCEILKLKEEIQMFSKSIQEKKKEESQYLSLTTFAAYFVVFLLLIMSIICLTVLGSFSDIFTPDVAPMYRTLTPRPT